VLQPAARPVLLLVVLVIAWLRRDRLEGDLEPGEELG
jgi:hypothetical protein